MRYFNNFADERQLGVCVYCGNVNPETRDHVPSKVLLEQPYPEHLPVIPVCKECNSNLSIDEEYVACFIESWRSEYYGKDFLRYKVRKIYERKPTLRTRIEKSLRKGKNKTLMSGEMERFKNVFIKLAKGHLLFEFNEFKSEDPYSIDFFLLSEISKVEYDLFNSVPQVTNFPEVGSRAMQRVVDMSDSDMRFMWQIVQENRYRYLVAQLDFVIIKIVIDEFFGCQVILGD